MPLRIALVSPPRTGSTLVARILWEHPDITHHVHEPFEACYWGNAGNESIATALRTPLDLALGERRALLGIDRGGLLLKEMSFQIDRAQFLCLAEVATVPVVFVVRDPRLCATSRLRIVKELNDADFFPPFESGWPSLVTHVETCRKLGIPYVIVDSDDLRRAPEPTIQALGDRLGLTLDAAMGSWQMRPGLALCSPDVGSLMGEARAGSDPFYRRVLASSGIEPPDAIDWIDEQRRIDAAGLAEAVADWMTAYHTLREDPCRVTHTR